MAKKPAKSAKAKPTKPKRAKRAKAETQSPTRVDVRTISGPVDLSDCRTRADALIKLRQHYEQILPPAEFANLVNQVIAADPNGTRDRWIFTLGTEAATLVGVERLAFDPKPKRCVRNADVGHLMELKVRNLATGRWRTYVNLETPEEVAACARVSLGENPDALFRVAAPASRNFR